MKNTNPQISCGIILENHRWFNLLEKECSHYDTRRISIWDIDHEFIHIQLSDHYEIKVIVSMGASISASIAEELREQGCSLIVRLGTTGALTNELKISDVILPIAAVRDEGTSRFYMPIEVPALAHKDMTDSLSAHLTNKGIRNYKGLVITTDGRWKEDKERLKMMAHLGVMAIDMESAALFAVGMDRSLPVVSASIVSDIPLRDNDEEFIGIIARDIWEDKVCPAFLTLFKEILEWVQSLNNI